MKNMASVLVVFLALAGAVGCDDSSGPTDAGCVMPANPTHDSAVPICEWPCNPGNELGVGKYCQVPGDCTGTASALCLTTLAPTSGQHYCTKTCADPDGGVADAGTNDCGTGATCGCRAPGQCACVPNYCFGP